MIYAAEMHISKSTPLDEVLAQRGQQCTNPRREVYRATNLLRWRLTFSAELQQIFTR